MPRTLYDSVTPTNILKANPNPQLVAGYLNGTYAWSAADWALFPNAVHVGISVRASYQAGHVLDVETGDATPAESVGWVQARRAAGADPTVYCNGSTHPLVTAAFQAAGVPEPHYWIATASGQAVIPAGAVAAQFLLDVAPGIDVSAVADYWPGVDAAPTTTSTTDTQEDEDVASDEIIGTGTGDDQPFQQLIVPVNGHKYLRIAVGWGAEAKLGGISLVDDTPANGIGSNVVTVQVGGVDDADRPGPWDLAVKGGANYGNFSHVAILAKAPAGTKLKAWTNDRP